MIELRLLTALPILVALGCGDPHEPLPLDQEPPTISVVTTPSEAVFPPLMTSLEGCLIGGGELVEVASVDNNDTREHGGVWTFGIAPDRRIAVASEDGTIKLWTLDGFVEELDPGAFLYGVEVEGSQVTDIAFRGDYIIAGDVRGVVSAWRGTSPNIIGGTDPDTSITAVAVDDARGWVAHADQQLGGNVMVRGMDDATNFGPLETDIGTVNDLAFVDGALLVVGRGEHPGMELRDREDPNLVLARFATDRSFNALTEVAVSEGAETIAFVSLETVGVVNDSLELRWITEAGHSHVPVSVDVAGTGRAIFTAGAEGVLRAWSGVDGTELAAVPVNEPVGVRVDAAGDLVIVGSRDGMLHAFSCEG